MIFEFPSEDDWQRISCTFPFKEINIPINSFCQDETASNDSELLFTNSELEEWTIHLINRLYDVHMSYVMLCFYFEKGIPDEEWCIPPRQNGESVQYFPHFTQYHFQIKSWFDYYVDTFYYKLFSALDTIGQILNIKYNLGIKKPDLGNVMKKLENMHPDIHNELKQLKDNPAFKEAKKLRNDITHNLSPSSISGNITKFQDATALSVGEYVPSATIQQNVIDVLYVFVEFLNYVKGDDKQSFAQR
jgi:hypothetical protein